MKHFVLGRTRSLHIQFLRYLFVGGSSAVVDIAVFIAAFELLHLHYLLANGLAFMFGLSWNYLLGIFWIFESRHNRAKEFLMVFCIAFAGLLWTSLLLYIFIDLLHLHAFLSKIIATWLVMFWNFGMRKYYVFH